MRPAPTITLRCHGALVEWLEAKTRRYYDAFWRCEACGQIYWRGSHVRQMQTVIDRVFE